MSQAFVSLDIDFFNPLNHSSLRPYLDQLVALCRGRHFIPIRAVMNHQQMLPLLNQSRATKVVNVDTHSDLSDPTVTEELNCGTWLTYYVHRRDSHYHWIHADDTRIGDCNGDDPIFRSNGADQCLTDWALVTHEKVRRPPNLHTLLCDASMVCVCSSPMYADDELIEQFNDWRKAHDIPYRKGRKDEWYGRKATPPRRKSLTAVPSLVESAV